MLHVRGKNSFLVNVPSSIGAFMLVVVFCLALFSSMGLFSLLLMYVGLALLNIPLPAYMLFLQKDAELRRYKWLIFGSWVLLIGSAAVSIIYLWLFPPNWEMYTGIGRRHPPSDPFGIMLLAMLPAFGALCYSTQVYARRVGYRFPGERLGDYLREKLSDYMQRKISARRVDYSQERGFMPYCAFCGNKLIEGQPFCANCGRKIEAQPYPLAPSESRPTVAELLAQPQRRPLSAFVLSLIGGAVIVLLGIWFSNRPTLSPAASRMAFAVSFLAGIPILCLALLLIRKPSHHETWGVLIIVFSALSFLGSGGFFVGMTLAAVGGALAIAWKEK